MLGKLFKRVKSFKPWRILRPVFRKLRIIARRHPIISLIVILLILLLVIILNNFLAKPTPVTTKSPEAKSVSIYQIGQAPKSVFQGKISKSKLVKITAQTSGIVQAVYVKEGGYVHQGTQLLTLASNYQGGNALAIQSQIAKANLDNANDTYSEQKDNVNKQRDLANRTDENANDLRDITDQSISETDSLISLDQSIISSLNGQINQLEATDSANPQITATQGLVSQYQNAVNSLSQAQRSNQYNSSDTNPPAEIADLQRDISLQQLDIQDKTLDLNKELSQLQYNLDLVNESLMYPVSPFGGIVERVYVYPGQSVTPGTPLFEILGDNTSATVEVDLPEGLAKSISRLEPSVLTFNDQIVTEQPLFVSTEAVDNQLLVALYAVPSNLVSKVSDGSYIGVQIPVGYAKTDAAIPFIPLDSIYQSDQESFVFVVKDNHAQSKVVSLGQVYGGFVEIKNGLSTGDQIILNRNLISGDAVVVTH